jgi:hypothetical protein
VGESGGEKEEKGDKGDCFKSEIGNRKSYLKTKGQVNFLNFVGVGVARPLDVARRRRTLNFELSTFKGWLLRLSVLKGFVLVRKAIRDTDRC